MNNKNFPVTFEKVEDVVDGRFTKVKVWIAHTGENRNRSIFTKEMLMSLIPSLKNVPITGYISQSDSDFKGHEEGVIVNGSEVSMKYLGHAYGVIPEENNARFEERYGEDGVKREYLVVEGVLWNKFSDAIDIFDESNGVKSQSMELENDYEGYFNEDNLFVFTKAKIDGVCILGEGIRPAMVSSTIEAFSVSSIKEEMAEMLSEFNTYFSASNLKEGEQMKTKTQFERTPKEDETEDVTVEETSETVETPEENVEESTENPETPETEESTEFAEKDKEVGDDEEEDEEETEETEDEEEDEEDKKSFSDKEVVVRQFAVSYEDTRHKIYESIDEHMNNKGHEGYFYIQETYAGHVLVSSYGNGYFKVSYSTENDEIKLGDVEEIFPMFLSKSEKDSIESDRVKREELETELASLRSFKAGKELEEKEAVLSTFSKELTEEEFGAIKSNLSNFSISDIEKEVGAVLLRKNRFSANTESKSQVRAMSSSNSGDVSRYGELSSLFYKN